MKIEVNTDASCATVCFFENGSSTSIGLPQMNFLLSSRWLECKQHIVEADVSGLLSFPDIDGLGLYFSNLMNFSTLAENHETTVIE